MPLQYKEESLEVLTNFKCSLSTTQKGLLYLDLHLVPANQLTEATSSNKSALAYWSPGISMRTKTAGCFQNFLACDFCYTSNNKGMVHSRRLGASPYATPLATPLATLDPFLDCLLAISLTSFITLPLFAHCISFCLLHLVQLPLLVLLNLGFFHLFQTVWAYIHSENSRTA
jgi:hypothetical protein